MNTRQTATGVSARVNLRVLTPHTDTFRWFCGSYLLILGMSFLILPQGSIGVWLSPLWFYGACIVCSGLGMLWLMVVNLPRQLTVALSGLIALPLLLTVLAYLRLASYFPAFTLGLLLLGMLYASFVPLQPSQSSYLPDLLSLILGLIAAAFGLDLLTRPGAAVVVPAGLGLPVSLVGIVFLCSGLAVVVSQLVAGVPVSVRWVAHLVSGGSIVGLWAAQAVYVDSLYWILGAATLMRGISLAVLPRWSRRIVGFDAQALRVRLALALITAALVPILIAIPVLLHTLNEQVVGRAAARPMAFGLTVLIALAAGIVGWWFAGRLTAPLIALIPSVNRIAQGQYQTALPTYGTTELVNLSQAVGHMAHTLEAREQERTHLYEAEHTARQRAELSAERTAHLQAITAALAATLTYAEVAAAFVSLAVEAIQASAGGLVRLIDDHTLETVSAKSYSTEAVQAWQRFPLDAPMPLAIAVRTAAPIWMDSPEAWHAYTTSPPLSEYTARAALPLIVEGKTVGGIGFSFAELRTFSDDDKAFMLILATQCAQAILRADLYAQVQTQAETLQQKVDERTQALQQALARAESADRAKSRMLANVSHEMRTPLSSIVGFSNLILQRNPDGDKLREYATLINQEGRRLTRLVNDFLDLQRIEAGREIFRLAPIDLAELVRDVSAHYDLSDKPRHTIQVNIDSTAPVQADQERIRQVIVNMLSNAIKYSPDGGTIQLELCQQGREVICAIRDQGIGILPGELPALFERFQRSESANYLRIQGTGLGLALCKEIIQLHNGRVWAESAGTGQGATFGFALPLKQEL